MGKELPPDEQRIYDFVLSQNAQEHGGWYLGFEYVVHLSNGSKLPLQSVPEWMWETLEVTGKTGNGSEILTARRGLLAASQAPSSEQSQHRP